MQKMLTHRTAALTMQTCPRKRFLSNHVLGSGITGQRLSIPLLTGSAFHKGMEVILRNEIEPEFYIKELESISMDKERKIEKEIGHALLYTILDFAILKAIEFFYDSIERASNLETNPNEDMDFVIKEQACLIEGMIRSWYVFRFPTFKQEFITLEVEMEEVYEDFSPSVTWLGKADGLLLSKKNNQLYVLSFKTATGFLPVTMRNILHDMQGLSEVACVEDRLNKLYDKLKAASAGTTARATISALINNSHLETYLLDCLSKNVDRIKVFAVQYEFVTKGQRKQDPFGSGIYKQDSFLVHPYKKERLKIVGTSAGRPTKLDKDEEITYLTDDEIELFYSSEEDQGFTKAEYKWKASKGRQPSGWNKINIWEDIGIKAWIEMLATGRVQPEEGNPFENICVYVDTTVFRTEEELLEWKVSTSYQEEQIAKHLSEIEVLLTYLKNVEFGDEDRIELVKVKIEEKLQMYFPKNTQSCHDFYGRDCPFVPICHESLSVEEGIEMGVYQRRIPHHELELKSLREKGILEDA